MIGDALAGVLLTLVAALGLAGQSLSVKLGTRDRSVADVVGAMFAVNLLVLLPLLVLRAPSYTLTPRGVGAFALAGLLGSLAARLAYFTGITRLGASRAEPLRALFPVVAVAIAVLALDESVTPVLAAGIALLLLGGVGVAMDSRSNTATASGRRLWLDLSFPLLAALFLGVDPVFTKVGFAEGTDPLVGLTVRIVAATAGFGLYVRWRRARTGEALSLRPSRWLLVAGVANTVYLLAYYAALTLAPVSVVAPLLGVSTLFTVAGAGLFLQREERVTWRLAAAAVLVVVGALVVVRA